MAEYTVVIDLDLGKVERAFNRLGDAFRRLGELLTPADSERDVTRRQVMRQCAGMRRREMRRSR